ncbi:MAG TPA: hypothetical protein VGE04_19425 [Chloroflexia bacterium]
MPNLDWSLVISMLALLLSVFSLYRTWRYEEFEYAPRIQISDEEIGLGSLSLPDAFSYKAKITNKGTKPAYIDRVYVSYGSREDLKKRFHFVITGKQHLSPGESVDVDFHLSTIDMEEAMRKLGIDECMFFIRVLHRTAKGKIIEEGHGLAGFGSSVVGGIPYMGTGK